MHVRVIALVVICGLAAAPGFGQEARDTATTMIDGKKVVIEYGRPALKGRNVAELMKQLPGDRIWRAGSGRVTILATETDLMIGGKKVPVGKYSLYIHCPESGEYSLVVNSDLGQPLGKVWAAAPLNQANEPYPHFEYTKEIGGKEVARVPLKITTVPATDLLTYAFIPSVNGALLTISWGDQAWSIEFRPGK